MAVKLAPDLGCIGHLNKADHNHDFIQGGGDAAMLKVRLYLLAV